MAKRAVLVGINYVNAPEECPPLSGCINDVWMMKDMLTTQYGFDENDITILIDDENDGSYEEPTGKNIIAALTEAVEASESGDVLVFTFSGHGAQQDDAEGDEADGQDEFLCGVDAFPITDDMLQSIFSRLPSDVRFTFISDCCHSGTMLDQPTQDVEISGKKTQEEAQYYEEGGDEDEDEAGAEYEDEEEDGGKREMTNRALSASQLMGMIQKLHGDPAAFLADCNVLPEDAEELGEDEEAGGQWLSGIFRNRRAQHKQQAADTPLPDYCVLISGCMDTQTSADASFDGQANGALTYSITSVLKDFAEQPTNREVVRAARGFLKQEKYDQNPCLSCGDGVADDFFICEVEEWVGGEGADEDEEGGEEEY